MWVKQADRGAGDGGLTTNEREEFRQLRRENSNRHAEAVWRTHEQVPKIASIKLDRGHYFGETTLLPCRRWVSCAADLGCQCRDWRSHTALMPTCCAAGPHSTPRAPKCRQSRYRWVSGWRTHLAQSPQDKSIRVHVTFRWTCAHFRAERKHRSAPPPAAQCSIQGGVRGGVPSAWGLDCGRGIVARTQCEPAAPVGN